MELRKKYIYRGKKIDFFPFVWMMVFGSCCSHCCQLYLSNVRLIFFLVVSYIIQLRRVIQDQIGSVYVAGLLSRKFTVWKYENPSVRWIYVVIIVFIFFHQKMTEWIFTWYIGYDKNSSAFSIFFIFISFMTGLIYPILQWKEKSFLFYHKYFFCYLECTSKI